MQVDFYQLSRDPVEKILPVIAQRLLEQGDRLMVIDGREGALDRLSRGLWEGKPESFLAHGKAGDVGEAMQPLLLCARYDGPPANAAQHIALTDGVWHDEALNFTRAFYFFDEATLDSARSYWRMLKGKDGVEPRFWRQEGRRWIQVA